MSAATSEILERSPLLFVAFIETIFTPIYNFFLLAFDAIALTNPRPATQYTG